MCNNKTANKPKSKYQAKPNKKYPKQKYPKLNLLSKEKRRKTKAIITNLPNKKLHNKRNKRKKFQ